MSTKRVFVDITGSSRGAVRAFEEAAIAADEASGTMGKWFEQGGKKVEGIFGKLGNMMQSNGIIGGAALVKMGEKFGQLETKGQKFHGILQEVGKASLLAGAGLALGIGAEGLHLADQFDAVGAQLKTAIKDAGGNFDELSPKIKAAYSHGAKFGFTMNDVAGALAMLTPAAGSPAKALGDLQMAENLARQRGETLGEAAQQLTSIYGGNVRALKQMGINLNIGSASAHALQQAHMTLTNAEQNLTYVQQEVASGHLKGAAGAHALMVATRTVTQDSLKFKQSQDAISLALAAVNKRTKGAADAFSHTFAGQLATARAETHNFGVEIGQHLVVFIGKAEVEVSKIITWFTKHKVIAEILAGVIGGVVVAAIGAYTISMIGAAAATIAAAAPVLAIIAGVALLGAGIYELATHWKTVWDQIKQWAQDAWSFIYNNLFSPIINFFTVTIPGTLAAAVGFFTALPGQILTALGDFVSTIWSGLTTAATWVDTNVIKPVVTYFTKLPAKIVTGLGDIVGTVFAALKTVGTWLDTNVWTPISGFFTGLPGKIATAAKGMWDGISAAFKDVINTIIGWWDGLHFKIPGFHIGPIHVGGFDLSVPQIPRLAAGGVVTTPTLALIGEAGPEMVIPMSQLGNYGIGATAAHPLPKGAGGAMGAGAKSGGVEINVTSAHYLNITGDLSSPQAKASLQRALDEHDHELITRIQNVIAA